MQSRVPSKWHCMSPLWLPSGESLQLAANGMIGLWGVVLDGLDFGIMLSLLHYPLFLKLIFLFLKSDIHWHHKAVFNLDIPASMSIGSQLRPFTLTSFTILSPFLPVHSGGLGDDELGLMAFFISYL